MEQAQTGKYPASKHSEIQVGELDWQRNPDNVTNLGRLSGWKTTIIPNAGHMLPKEYVQEVLDRWLNMESD